MLATTALLFWFSGRGASDWLDRLEADVCEESLGALLLVESDDTEDELVDSDDPVDSLDRLLDSEEPLLVLCELAELDDWLDELLLLDEDEEPLEVLCDDCEEVFGGSQPMMKSPWLPISQNEMPTCSVVHDDEEVWLELLELVESLDWLLVDDSVDHEDPVDSVDRLDDNEETDDRLVSLEPDDSDELEESMKPLVSDDLEDRDDLEDFDEADDTDDLHEVELDELSKA